MHLHDLSPAPGSRRKPKRLGCGVGSGTGKTAGKGHKGQKARTGGGVSRGFEGGQMPVQRRVPKRGFNNARHAVNYEVVNLGSLEERFESGAEITATCDTRRREYRIETSDHIFMRPTVSTSAGSRNRTSALAGCTFTSTSCGSQDR